MKHRSLAHGENEKRKREVGNEEKVGQREFRAVEEKEKKGEGQGRRQQRERTGEEE